MMTEPKAPTSRAATRWSLPPEVSLTAAAFALALLIALALVAGALSVGVTGVPVTDVL